MAPAKPAAERYDPTLVLRVFEDMCRTPHDVPIDLFVIGLTEVVKVVRLLGAGLGLATRDIDLKRDTLNTLLEDMKTRFAASPILPPRESQYYLTSPGAASSGEPQEEGIRLTIQQLVDDEISRKVERRNDKEYTSGARATLRMLWFFDFIHCLITNMAEQPKDELRTCAHRAYESSLGTHHPWIVRKAVGAAMITLPYRATFLSNFRSQEEGMAAMVQWIGYVGTLKEAMWTFFRHRGLEVID